MKKNWILRIAVLMAVLTLATSCFVSGTFAKYVTSGTATDNARVAKFGVTITGSSDLFATEYAKHDGSFSLAANTVVSSDSDKLVAPGTEGSLATLGITGTPEVAVRVAYKVNTLTLTNWTYNTEFYCPLTITVNTVDFCGLDYADADAFAAAVKTAIEGYTKDYAANTDLSGVTTDDLAISWAWAFEGATGSAQTDVKDTYLGDQAAAGNAATIALDVTCSVTQID